MWSGNTYLETFKKLLSSVVSLDYPTIVNVVLQPTSTAFESPVNSEVWLVHYRCQEEALFSLICQSPVKDSAQPMGKKKIDEKNIGL